MVKINFSGNILGSSSGYVSHSRQLLNALIKQGVEVAYTGQLVDGWEKQVNDDELKAIKQEPFINENILAISLPNQWAYQLAEPHKVFCGYVVWEGTKVPDYWLKYFADERVDYLIVPSEHTKQAILNTLKDEGYNLSMSDDAYWYYEIPKKIIIIPHGVNHELFQPVERKDDGIFRIVSNGGWAQGVNDRKGLQFLIKAFVEEFKEDEPVELFVKINPAYLQQGWNLDNELAKLNLPQNGGRLMFNLDNIPFENIKGFYGMGDVYACTTMCEAFGLPMLEAMSCGLPIITTAFGGQCDFVTDDNGWIINQGEMVENNWDILYEDISWFKPDIQAIRKVLREVYNNKSLVKNKGLKALKTSQEYDWNKSADMIKKLLK